MFLEDADERLVGGRGLGADEAPGRVPVEAVRDAQLRVPGLGPQERFEGERRVVHDDSGGLVGDEVVRVLEQHGHAFRAARDGGGRAGEPRHGDDGPGAEAVVRHPDAPAVHADAPRVDPLLGGAARNAQVRREEILQGRAVLGARDDEGRVRIVRLRFHGAG